MRELVPCRKMTAEGCPANAASAWILSPAATSEVGHRSPICSPVSPDPVGCWLRGSLHSFRTWIILVFYLFFNYHRVSWSEMVFTGDGTR